ncbi:probable inactive receptor kinase At1g48480 [Malania oleifera]|uniref:probable inactive receptor kinase At1g48480 n=1 Tax=Malania oleifera TaxID=397392 RepID=UPI0025AE23D0|nr:probable inactive receptor kinase At1g48480 [Malania oleifera]
MVPPHRPFHLPFTTVVVVVFLLFPAATPDLDADRAALLSLREAVGGETRLWDPARSDPCSWRGILCADGRVTEVRLPGDGLAGDLPPNTLGNLTHLRRLSLRRNSLSGQLPPDLGSCLQLRVLNLQTNRFSGELPTFLFRLSRLVSLDLAGNSFSAEIPSEFNNLPRLKTLNLARNRLTGSIPDLPPLQNFNVSHNGLNGSIPRSLQNFPADAFIGNPLCGFPLQSCPGGGNKLSGFAIAGIATGSVVSVLVIALILCLKMRNGKAVSAAINQSEAEIRMENRANAGRENGGSGERRGTVCAAGRGEDKELKFLGDSGGAFGIEELLKSSAELLGRGTYGTSYKVELEGRGEVAVKRLRNVCVPEREFKERVEELGNMVHVNLLPVRAYFYGKGEQLFVSDFAPMGSLSALLHGTAKAERVHLSWEVRSSIATGTAKGIEHLHAQGLSHGNVKSSNVLLIECDGARLSDYAISQLASPDDSRPRCLAYRAPELINGALGVPLQKADVYSFGVLLFELLTGKTPAEGGDGPGKLVESVGEQEWGVGVLDPELHGDRWDCEEQMVMLLRLAVCCTSWDPERRPSMSEVRRQLEIIFQSEQ